MNTSRRSAYTMMELMLVLVMLTLIVGISIGPVRSWLSRSELDRTSSALVQMVQEGRYRSTREGRSWSLRLSDSPVMLYLEPTDASERRSERKPLDFSTARSLVHKLPKELRIQIWSSESGAMKEQLIFSPSGFVSTGQVNLYQRNRLVDVFVTDRLTGGIRKRSSHASKKLLSSIHH